VIAKYQSAMGNSKNPEGTGRKGKKKKIVQKNQEAYLARTGTTFADAGVAARRALAIQRGGLEAAEGIRNRALKQRDESRAETAEAKSSLQAVSHQLVEQKGKLNLEQDLRHESDAALAQTRVELHAQRQLSRELEVKRAASEAHAVELGKTLEEVREKGKTTAQQNLTILEEFGMTAGDWTPCGIGQADKGNEDALQEAIIHERIKVSRLERKAKIMAPLLAKLRAQTVNLKKQVSKVECIFFSYVERLVVPACAGVSFYFISSTLN